MTTLTSPAIFVLVPDQYPALVAERNRLEADCADPEKWADLARRFAAIDSMCNAAACQRRADHYRQVQAEEAALKKTTKRRKVRA